MNDIDLDELDQAVNKIMSRPSKKQRKAASLKHVESTHTPEKSVDEPAVPKEEPKNESTPTRAESAEDRGTTVVVKRTTLRVPPRRGSAMDIIQPKPLVPPSVRPARVAATLQPTRPVVEPEPSKPAPEPPVTTPHKPEPEEDPLLRLDSEPTSAEPAKNEPSDDTLASLNLQEDAAPTPGAHTEEAHRSAWPDPLELHDFTDKPDPKPEPKKEETPPAVEPAPTVTAKHEPEEEEPSGVSIFDDPEDVTPFVPAKVTKRPLGAYADKAEPAPSTPDAPKEELPAPEPPKDTPSPKPTNEPEFTPFGGRVSDDKEEAGVDSLRQMSIPQQYHAAEAKASEGDRPIFDTKEYHPPLKPAPVIHKKSHAGVIITIVIIVLVLAAAAFGFYMVTGSLDITRLW